MVFPSGSRSDVGPIIFPHTYYSEFIHLLRDFARTKRIDSSIAVITFNYDLGLDYAFSYTKTPYHYGLETEDSSDGIPFLKLHGSLNWSICKECNKAVVYFLNEYCAKHPLPKEKHTPLIVSRYLNDIKHCDQYLSPEPFIVPPTWNKTEYHNVIADVWKKAVFELSQATNIFVLGYSFPSTDQFVRHLLALSLASGEILDQFVVINPDAEVSRRFESMLSDQVQAVFQESALKFENSNEIVREYLEIETHPWNETWDI
jgi:hypothetical protein